MMARCSTGGSIFSRGRPLNLAEDGIFVAITVMYCTLASSGSDAM